MFNKYFIGVLFVFFSSCHHEEKASAMYKVSANTKTSSKKSIPKTSLILKPDLGLVFYKDEPFTGTSVQYYKGNILAESIDYIQGKREGVFKKWFLNGILSFESFYADGKKHGANKTWWKNGNIRSEANYIHGVANGIQRQWYITGEKFKELTLVNGREEGMQRAWRRNGKIYNNYEAKNGRIFGLKRASLCYELEEEQIQNEEL